MGLTVVMCERFPCIRIGRLPVACGFSIMCEAYFSGLTGCFLIGEASVPVVGVRVLEAGMRCVCGRWEGIAGERRKGK